MALLNARGAAWMLLATALGAALGACSFALDPDDLEARLIVVDTFVNDTHVADTTPDVAPDTTPETVEDTVVETVEDTTPEDTADTVEPVDVDVVEDTKPLREVVVHYSGESDVCQLNYFQGTLLDSCPETCPVNTGWSIKIDASASVGVGSFSWRFGATDLYTVTPTTATGPVVTLTLKLPSCDLLNGSSPTSGSITVELGVDGEARETYPSIRFFPTNTNSSSTCKNGSKGDCPDWTP